MTYLSLTYKTKKKERITTYRTRHGFGCETSLNSQFCMRSWMLVSFPMIVFLCRRYCYTRSPSSVRPAVSMMFLEGTNCKTNQVMIVY